MKKRRRNLILLLALLGALTAVLFLVRRLADRQGGPELIIPHTADRILSISYRKGEEEIGFRREKGLWVKTDDPGFEADQTKVGTLVSSVTGIAVTHVLEAPEDPGEFGLGDTARELVVTGPDGEEIRLSLGLSNPQTGDLYCLKEGTEGMMTVRPGIAVCLDHDAEYYREGEDE